MLDYSYWERVSKSIARACARDQEALPRVKADYAGHPDPCFGEPLAWLNEAWILARKPRGRPRDLKGAYQLEYVYRFLTNPPAPTLQPDDEPERIGGLRMSTYGALDVMSGLHFDPREQKTKKKYGALPAEFVNALSKKISEILGQRVPDMAEIWRVNGWVKGQRNPQVRLKGEPVRPRKRSL